MHDSQSRCAGSSLPSVLHQVGFSVLVDPFIQSTEQYIRVFESRIIQDLIGSDRKGAIIVIEDNPLLLRYAIEPLRQLRWRDIHGASKMPGCIGVGIS